MLDTKDSLTTNSYVVMVALIAILTALQLACWFTDHQYDFTPYIVTAVGILLGFFGGGKIFTQS